jgi:hypothetical protein
MACQTTFQSQSKKQSYFLLKLILQIFEAFNEEKINLLMVIPGFERESNPIKIIQFL